MSYDLGTAKGTIDIDSSGAIAGTTTAAGAMAEMRRGTLATSTALMTAGRHLTIIGGLAVAGFGLAVHAAAKFETEMSNFKAISQANEQQMDRVRETALRLGRDTVFSAQEAAEAMSELSKAGLSTGDILNGAADAAVALAAAGGVDIPTAATVAANAMNTFNVSAEDMMSVADSFAGTANRTATDVTELAEAIRYTGASASVLHLPLGDVNVALGILANRGLRGSIAGTNLNRMLINLQPSSDNAADAMRDLGIITEDGSNKFFDQEGRAKSLAEISQVLQDSLRGLTDQQKIQKLETIFGSRALQAATALAEEGATGFNRLKRQIGNVSAEEVAAEKLNNLNGSIEYLRGSIETFMIKAGEGVQGPLKSLVDMFAHWINILSELNPEILQWGLIVLGAVGGVLLLAGAFIYLTGAWMKFKFALQATGIAEFLVNPWFLVIAAIVAVALALYYAYTHFEGFRKKVDAIIRSLEPTFNAIKEWVINAFNVFMEEILPQIIAFGREFMSTLQSIIETVMSWGDEIVAAVSAAVHEIMSVWDWLWANVGPVVEAIVGLFSVLVPKIISFFKAILPFFQGIFHGLQTIVNAGIQIILRAWHLFGDNIVEAGRTAWNFIQSIISAVMQVIRGIIQTVTGIITGDWSKAWEGIKAIFSGIWRAIIAYLANAWGIIRNIFFTALDAIRLVWHEGWNAIKAVLVAVWSAIKGLLKAGWNVIKGIWNGALNFLKSMWNSAWNNIKNILRSAWNAIKTAVQAGIDAVLGFLRGLPSRAGSAIARIVSVMFNKGLDALRGLKRGAERAWEAAKDWLSDLPGKIGDAVGNMADALVQVGRDVIDGLKRGMEEAWDRVTGWLSNLNPANWFNDINPEKGHAEKNLIPVGEMVMQGLQRGMESGWADITSWMQGIDPSMFAQGFIPSPALLRRSSMTPVAGTTISTRHGDTYQTNVRTDADPDEIMDAFKWMSAVKVNRKRVGSKT